MKCVMCGQRAVGKASFCGTECEDRYLWDNKFETIDLLRDVYRLCRYDGRESTAVLDADLVKRIVDFFEAKEAQ